MLKGGRIITNEGWSSIDCTVRNFSETGAKITFSGLVETPDEFELLIVSDQLIYSARRRWTRGQEIGVEFVGRPRPARSL